MNRKEEIENELRELRAKQLLKAGTNPFQVAEHYFQELPAGIVTSIKANSLKEIPDALTVPENYFENLPHQIIQQTKTKKQVRIISFIQHVLRSFKYAVAAMLILFAGLTYFHYAETGTDISKELAAIPQEDIREYINLHIDEFEEEWIAEYATVTEQGLQSLKQKEIIQYLNENGWD